MMIVLFLGITALSLGLTYVTWPNPVSGVFMGLAVFEALNLTRAFKKRERPIVELLGFKWNLNDFCRGWLITGMTGSGKTVAAINTLLWQVSKNCPSWGGVCIDEKGLFWETLSSMFKALGKEKDLILLQVRPDGADKTWKPKHRFNFLTIPGVTYSAHAQTICDVASSLGQKGGNAFFKTQAQIHIEWALKALDEMNHAITLKNCYDFLADSRVMDSVQEELLGKGTLEAKRIAAHFDEHFRHQPPEQLGGVKQTIFNYLKFFLDPDIAEVFCPEKSTFSFDAIDSGKVICLSIPQKYIVERRYIKTLLKLNFYTHAFRRFDKPAEERKKDNLIILWADEAQKIVTASEDGTSDYNSVDVIREAKATIVAATQSFMSLIPPMGNENKTKVFISNMGNRITFKASDEESAKIAANTVGKKETKKYTQSTSKGGYSRSFSLEEKYCVAPHEFRKFKKFQAVIQHCEHGWKKGIIKPLSADGKRPKWY